MALVDNLSRLLNLSGKVAIVTGGAMGIGLGIVSRLAEAGANVVIADVNEEVGHATIKKLQENGFKVAFVKADVSNAADVKGIVNFAVKTYGGIDILVNNAGVYPVIRMLEMQLSDFEKVININLKSVFMLTKAVSEIMILQGRGGKIINISSIDAIHPSSVGLAVYDASKHGIWGFTKNTALELAPHNISVNAIAPGSIATPGSGANRPITPDIEAMTKKFLESIPMKRVGETDDIGKVALFLASDMSSYMTGSQIVVDGGVLLS